MNTVKTIILTVVVGAIGYGAYLVFTQEPPVMPEGVSEDWATPPTIDMVGAPSVESPGFPGAPATTPSADTATPFGSPGTAAQGNSAPAFPAPTAQAPGAAGQPGASHTAMEPPSWAVAPANPNANDATGLAPPLAVGTTPPNFPVDSTSMGSPVTNPAVSGPLPPASVGTNAADTNTALPSAGAGFPTSVDAAQAGTPWPPANTIPNPSDSSSPFAAMVASVQTQLDAGQVVEAHRELSRWYGRADLAPADQQKLLQLLDAVTGTVVYSRDFHAEAPYDVQPGDDLERIAQQFNVPWQFLARINGIGDPRELQPGQRLKVVRGPFTATVDMAAGLLTLWLDDLYAGRFPIGRPATNPLPEGEFTVRTKIENPTFYGQDRTVDADDPQNPLGERWIELADQVGIHGAVDVTAPVHPDTAGCIRMSPTDVEDLYDILSVGSRIMIRR